MPQLTQTELQNARANFGAAFGEMGGIASLTAWGKRNRTQFYKLYGKLIPLEVNTTHTHTGRIEVVTGVPGPEELPHNDIPAAQPRDTIIDNESGKPVDE